MYLREYKLIIIILIYLRYTDNVQENGYDTGSSSLIFDAK